MLRPPLEDFAKKADHEGYWQETGTGGPLGWREALQSICEYSLSLEAEIRVLKDRIEVAAERIAEEHSHYATATDAALRSYEDYKAELRDKDRQIAQLTERLVAHEASRRVRKILGVKR
jgi:hypothetical protein